jgi:hypothetical protein
MNKSKLAIFSFYTSLIAGILMFLGLLYVVNFYYPNPVIFVIMTIFMPVYIFSAEISIFVFFLTIIGFITSIISLIIIKKSLLDGKKYAIYSLVISLIIFLIFFMGIYSNY